MVDRKYFEEIGLLDEGMEIYGGENVELGIRVSRILQMAIASQQESFLIFNTFPMLCSPPSAAERHFEVKINK